MATKGLKIKSDKGQILDAQVIKQSDKSNAFVISECTSAIVEIKYDYIDSREGVKLQVLHTGNGNELFVEGKIKGGKSIRNCQNIVKYKGINGFLLSLQHELMPMFFVTIGLLLSALIFQVANIPINEYMITVTIFAFIIATILMLIYIKICKKIKKMFNRSVPQNLKE